ncbi:MAG: alkaline phosphatase family protein [Actinobacteria bacterium]|nr:alkaline phosphatase family protein [Actinomycetota bacterium]
MPASNVLFITVDQWRGDCLSAGGHPVVRTPNLDALAARGVRFANHWSVTAPCGPSRASLLTGRYLMNHRSVHNGTPLDDGIDNLARVARAAGFDPTLFGYTDTTVDVRRVADPDDPRLRDYEGVLPGFRVGTLLTGGRLDPWLRWLERHGIDVPADPERLFDGIADYPGADDRAPSWAPGPVPAALTETAFLTEEVCRWLDRRGGDGWFAHVSYLRPHPPYRAPEGYHDRYDPDDGEPFRRLDDRDEETSVHRLHAAAVHITGCDPDEAVARQVRATYWGNMAEVDDRIGELLAHLDALGATDDTLIVLTSDHGDQMGDHWLVQKLGWWDESFHVPLIVVDPRPDADATRGTVVDAFTESVDVMPTICEWIGAEVPVAVDGRSLGPFLHDGAAPADWRDAAHWQWDFGDPDEHLAEDVYGLTMEECRLDVIRTATEKYVRFGDGSSLYFDLASDPYGLRDLATDPATAGAQLALAGDLLTWRQRHDDRTLTGHLVTPNGLVVRRDARR